MYASSSCQFRWCVSVTSPSISSIFRKNLSMEFSNNGRRRNSSLFLEHAHRNLSERVAKELRTDRAVSDPRCGSAGSRSPLRATEMPKHVNRDFLFFGYCADPAARTPLDRVTPSPTVRATEKAQDTSIGSHSFSELVPAIAA